MTKRIKYYLAKYEELLQRELSVEEAKREIPGLLKQIDFFQHERLIHLIVTVLFALLTVITLFANLFLMQPLLLVLFLLFLILLIPYIAHYYLLENGVQKLYEYYDKLEEMTRRN